MEEERIGLFIDYENLAIGAREDLGITFDFKPIADALAERGRVVVRRAYADWISFEADRRMLTDNHVELIEIPQRRGAVRKNAADIKMAVDAIELAFEREYVTTFVVCTGDSDFTPLVTKLRELDKRVIGVGLKASTSALLPPACDEFLFYENLDGVDLPAAERRRPSEPEVTEPTPPEEVAALDSLIAGTVVGLQRSSSGQVRSSSVKRALIRKDPTFTEADYGFRTFGELLRHLEQRKVVELNDEGTVGDPIVTFPEEGSGEDPAFALLTTAVRAAKGGGGVPLSGLKNELRKRQPGFSEKRLGYSSFLQFIKAAAARGVADYEWDDSAGDYLITVP
jgi:uncharacterized protein (TIGR00288 family)